MSTGILPQSGQQQFDNATGAFLNGGKLYIYNAGTTTPASIFSDFALTATLPSPVILNSSGRIPAIYSGTASVRMKLLNSASVQQVDIDNIAMAVAASGGGGGSAIVPQQTFLTGDIKIAYTDQPIDGYVRLNGRTIGSGTSGGTERANADAQPLFLALWGFANISVVTGKGASAAADWAANKQLTLPDMAGRLIGARDDLGNGAAGRITSATVTGPTVVGATGGTEKGTIAQGNLPNVNFTVSGITLGDTTAYTFGYSNGTFAAGAGTAVVSLVNSGGGATITPTKTGAVTVSAQGTAASGGSGTAFNTIAPVMLFTIYIKL